MKSKYYHDQTNPPALLAQSCLTRRYPGLPLGPGQHIYHPACPIARAGTRTVEVVVAGVGAGAEARAEARVVARAVLRTVTLTRAGARAVLAVAVPQVL